MSIVHCWKYHFEDGEAIFSFRRLNVLHGRAEEYRVELQVIKEVKT